MSGSDRDVTAPFVVCICTRNRDAHLTETLAALAAQTRRVPVVVVDQSDVPVTSRPDVTVIADRGRGLSRARNVALRVTAERWLVFLDDDCVPEPEWAGAIADELAAQPDLAFLSGYVGARNVPATSGEFIGYSLFPVETAATYRGRDVAPDAIGFGVCFGVRRDWALRLGGWDERLGPGVPAFPASDDMDFNYRLLRAGGTAHVTPRPRAHHDQWRTEAEVIALYGGYMASWIGFTVKTLRTGDPRGALRFAAFSVKDVARYVVTGLLRRSPTRVAIARSKLRGVQSGLPAALAERW